MGVERRGVQLIMGHTYRLDILRDEGDAVYKAATAMHTALEVAYSLVNYVK